MYKRSEDNDPSKIYLRGRVGIIWMNQFVMSWCRVFCFVMTGRSAVPGFQIFFLLLLKSRIACVHKYGRSNLCQSICTPTVSALQVICVGGWWTCKGISQSHQEYCEADKVDLFALSWNCNKRTSVHMITCTNMLAPQALGGRLSYPHKMLTPIVRSVGFSPFR